ncbi:MAG: CBS domain-containing protein [Anaerolineales bacterium]
MTKTVRDLMRPSLITCPAGTTLSQAAALLARHGIHALVISDPAGLAIGVLSDMDLMAGDWLIEDPARLAAKRVQTAGDFMTRPPATIDGDAPPAEAAQRMRRDRLHRLIVTELDRPVGIIAVSDLVHDLAPGIGVRQTVAEAMSRGLVVCREITPISGAARAMRERRSRSVVVVDAHGRPLGVVTGFDLLPFCDGGDVSQPVSTVMHPPITILPTASLREAAAMMLERHIHRLLVLDPAAPDGMPLGLISTADIVVEMAWPYSSPRVGA